MKFSASSLRCPVRALTMTLFAGFFFAAMASPARAGTVAGWDVHSMAGGVGIWGASPLPATASDANLNVGGMTRGGGVLTPSGSTAAARAWGGTGWSQVTTDDNGADALAHGQYITFTVSAKPGYQVSFSQINRFDYRRSTTGPSVGVLQYQVDSSAFNNITSSSLSYSSTSSSGGSIGAVDLSGISALQNVSPGTTITFRIASYKATSSAGTWYIFDTANSSANDFEVQGTVTSIGPTATQVQVETAANGSGTLVPAQTITTGNSITVYAVSRDASNTFVANVAAAWSLTSKTDGVVDGDLVASGDGKSAVFTAHGAGSAVIHTSAAGLTSTDSGLITVQSLPTPPTATGQAVPSVVPFDQTVQLQVGVVGGLARFTFRLSKGQESNGRSRILFAPHDRTRCSAVI